MWILVGLRHYQPAFESAPPEKAGRAASRYLKPLVVYGLVKSPSSSSSPTHLGEHTDRDTSQAVYVTAILNHYLKGLHAVSCKNHFCEYSFITRQTFTYRYIKYVMSVQSRTGSSYTFSIVTGFYQARPNGVSSSDDVM